ncbi:MAG: metallophosphoesterase [Thermoprotei archaeon]|jgi:putative phosphoesterase
MKVLVISDTHDNLFAIKKLLKQIENEKITYIFHAGDIIAPFTLKLFNGYKLIGVYGNNDGERNLLRETAKSLGFKLEKDFENIELNGRKIALIHGTEKQLVEALIKSQLYDVVISGHTHVVEQYIIGKTLAINPGELCGYLTNKSSYIILDLDTLQADVRYLD